MNISKELKLTFELEIISYEFRKIELQIKGILHETTYSANFVDWFMEDLITFLESSTIGKRWDIDHINIHGFENMKLNPQQALHFKQHLKDVTSWTMGIV